MGIGISIFIGAVGAIMRYAVTLPANQHGFNIHTGGVIFMIVGAVGLLLSMLFRTSFAPFGRHDQLGQLQEVIPREGHELRGVQREGRDHAN